MISIEDVRIMLFVQLAIALAFGLLCFLAGLFWYKISMIIDIVITKEKE